MKYYVYRHIRLDKNLPFYIGIGCTPNYRRAYNTYNRNPHWKRIVAKTNYTIDIIYECNTLEEANLKEVEFIKLYGRVVDGGTLCNITIGGDGSSGIKLTEDHKDKIRKFNTGVKFTDDRRRKIGEKSRGRKLSSSSIEKIRNSMLGRVTSESTKQLMRNNCNKNLLVIDLNTGIYYQSISEVASTFNLNRRSLSKTIRQSKKNYTQFRVV